MDRVPGSQLHIAAVPVTNFAVARGPRRIVCLTEEPTEILYRLGEGHRIVGISAYTVRPPEARRDKPVVSAFIGGSVRKIAALKPDLVVGFSDVQANLARKLIAANLPVLIFNQRSIQEILDVIVHLGALVHKRDQARELVATYIQRLEDTQRPAGPTVHAPISRSGTIRSFAAFAGSVNWSRSLAVSTSSPRVPAPRAQPRARSPSTRSYKRLPRSCSRPGVANPLTTRRSWTGRA